MRKITSLYIVLLMLGGSMISGCATIPTNTPSETRLDGALKRHYFDVNIPSHDGTLLRATIFQPELAPGETAPLIIHAHGFGVFRMSAPLSIYGLMIYSGIAAKEAWNNNYWVISFDQRGHGQSDGMIRIMDPDYEVKDVPALIDWAMANISRITKDAAGDPEVGMIGESYGGGAQLMSAAVDKRIDAIIPITTWSSFETSLTPGQVPKSGWLTTLITVGNTLNPGHMEPLVNNAYWEARSGKIAPEVFEFLHTHSPRYNCEKGALPDADILLIQGMRDVLFPLNEAKENFECLSNGENDVRLIATQDGHLLPLTQWSPVPGYHVESTVHCDEHTIDMSQMAVDWFDEKLKKKPGKASYIPTICITQDYDSGTVFKTIPVASESFTFNDVTLHSNFTGLFEAPLGLLERMGGYVLPNMTTPALADFEDRQARLRPAFVPLKVMKKDAIMAGIPWMNIRMSPLLSEQEPVAFVGVAVKRARGRHIELIDQQVTPIRGEGKHTGDMIGVSTRLHKDDIVGLIISGYSNQYRFSGGDWFVGSTLTGEVKLPIIYNSAEHSDVAYH